MADYSLLVFAALLDATKSCLSRKLGRYADHLRVALLLNWVRAVLCTFLGFVLCVLTDKRIIAPRMHDVALIVLSGLATAVFMVSWLLSMKESTFVMLTVISAASCIVPVLLSSVMLGERIRIQHCFGILILTFSSYLLSNHNRALKGKLTLRGVLLLVTVFISEGLQSFFQKLYMFTVPSADPLVYNTWSFFMVAIIIPLSVIILRKGKTDITAKELVKKNMGIIIIMSFCMFGVFFLRTVIAQSIPAAVQYPMSNGIVILVNSLFSTVLLKERQTARGIIGVVTAITAIAIISQ